MEQSGSVLAILFTMTTYGTWLRGDERGWVEDGRILSANPPLEQSDRQRMKYPPFNFPSESLHGIGDAIGRSLITRLDQKILALTVQTWHVHFVVSATRIDVADVAKCAKDAVRYHLRPGRPIWTDGYDKRFCFDDQSVYRRINYVERHNIDHNHPARPWPFIIDWRK